MSGIDNIIEMIKTKTKERERSIIADAEKLQRERLQQVEDSSKEKADSIVEKAEREAKAALSRHEASLKLRTKHKVLESKDLFFTEIVEVALEEIKKIVKSKKYADVIKNLAVDGGISLGESKIELILPEGTKVDLTLAAIAKAIGDVTGQKTSVKISKDTVRASGGVMVRTDDGSKWVDNCFEARHERLESEIRNSVFSILFE